MTVSKQRTEVVRMALICVLLTGVMIVAFWRINYAGFVNLDDLTYVAENVRVQQGLSIENVKWAFTTFYFGNWHPLTWLSYMLDCSLFGPGPRAMHVVNLGFHVANAVLLFLLLKRMTAAVWASAVVAGLFAVHPLHVESVAWISERKDVLSTLFWILTMWAYVEYTRRRCAGCYAAALILFALGLMSKAMLVSLPFVLLLIDFWPLRRIQFGPPEWHPQIRRLVFEKLPFFALAVLSGYLTFLAQRQGEAVTSFAQMSLTQRVENAVVSYARYLGKTFWPSDLAVYYPHPFKWIETQVVGATLLFVTLTAVVFSLRKFPYLWVGWCWFVGSLIPVIGLVQVGGQSMADRYSYVPHIGLFMAVVWIGRELVIAKRLWGPVALGLAAAVWGALAVKTWHQTRYWSDSLSLFDQAARVSPPNALIHLGLGKAYLDLGDRETALKHCESAVALEPNNVWTHARLASLLSTLGQSEKAIDHYRAALQLNPDTAPVLNNLAWMLATHPDAKFRNGTEAVRLAERAVQLSKRKEVLFLGTLAAAYAEAGRFDDAVKTAEEAIKLAEQCGQTALVSKNRQLIGAYRQQRPWREPEAQ